MKIRRVVLSGGLYMEIGLDRIGSVKVVTKKTTYVVSLNNEEVMVMSADTKDQKCTACAAQISGNPVAESCGVY